jgi:hypothetical protein
MREFRIDPRKGTLRQDPLTMTPRGDLNSTPALGLFLSSITGGLNRHDYQVPRSYPVLEVLIRKGCSAAARVDAHPLVH